MAGWVRAAACPHRLEDEPRSMAGMEWEEAALPPRKNESEISERRPSATQLALVENGSMFGGAALAPLILLLFGLRGIDHDT